MRVVVCGTTFGQVYLEGVRLAGPEFTLAGVLARGSERSERCARRYGVPLFTDVDELPGDVDIACVVIRSGLLGGTGVELAQRLLDRGINVLQEHPLHHDELAECLRHARRAGAVYQLNSFYPHVAPVRRFIAATRRLAAHSRVQWVDAACGFQLSYSLLDILGIALEGVRPWELGQPGARRSEATFQSLDGLLGDVATTLRIQNEMDPSDPDNHAHLDHRITIGAEGGNLTLVNTHGPIVFSHRPRYPHAPRDPGSDPHFGAGAPAAEPPSAAVAGAALTPGFGDVFGELWPPAVKHALLEARSSIVGDDRAMLRSGQHHLSTCLLWQDITAALGPPKLIRRPAPTALSQEQVGDVVAAAAADCAPAAAAPERAAPA